MNLVFADLLYNVRRGRYKNHVDYDLFTSKDKKALSKVLADKMKSGANAHVLRSALKFANWYTAFVPEKMEEKARGRGDSREQMSERQASNVVKMRKTFEIVNSELHHIRVFVIYQQKTSIKRAAHV